MDIFLETGNLNTLLSIKDVEIIVLNLLLRKTLGQ